jgi:hypothetical protein
VARTNYEVRLKADTTEAAAHTNYEVRLKADTTEVAHTNYEVRLKADTTEVAHTNCEDRLKADTTEAAAHTNYAVGLKADTTEAAAHTNCEVRLKADTTERGGAPVPPMCRHTSSVVSGFSRTPVESATAPASSPPAATSPGDVFGSPAAVVYQIVAKKTSVTPRDGAESILGVAVVAFVEGAGHVSLEASAIDCFRGQCAEIIRAAVGSPSWHAAWRREKVYLLAWAEAAGRRAAQLAVDDGRTVIAGQDVHDARIKMRGYMPVSGRWCPP